MSVRVAAWWRAAGLRRRVVLIGSGTVLAVLVAAMVVVGGGGGSGASNVDSAAPARSAPAIAGGSATGESADAPRVVAPDAGAVDERLPGVPPGGVQRQLVRSAQLAVEVDDPAVAARRVRTAAAVAGGFVTQERSEDTGSTLELRVPADALDRLVDEIAGYGRVTNRGSQVLDATEEVVDLDARVASGAASVARVRGLLAEATSMGDVVAIEAELARRESDLDSLTRRLAALRDQVALSTLTVDLRGPAVAPPPPDVRPAPGFLDGLAAGWAGLRAIGTAAAAVVGFVLPFLPPLGLLAGCWVFGRRILRARRAPVAAAAGGRSGPGSEGES